MVRSNLTIVMYHFVRDLEHSRYPEIKGLRVEEFKEQLGYIEKYYNVVRMEDVIDAFDSGQDLLPPNPLLLTFDDGYIDHFTNVFPILNGKRMQGSFFPPSKAIKENRVLDVNKIHFLLASVSEKSKIVESIFSMLDELREEYPVQPNEHYQRIVSTESRFDTSQVTFIKAMLQRELPEEVRKVIVDRLFRKYVTSDEAAFSSELYMNLDQIRCMNRNGMFIGSHGYDHYWIGTLDPGRQEREIDLCLGFLNEIGSALSDWVMCYPYGSYNDSLLEILNKRGCKLGLTVNVDIADLGQVNPLLLPRLDTNDLPKDQKAKPNEWTRKARRQGDRF
jgi:peptidoglycan/xylan/chitin deacetylase (PgdA/CDA1 family)